MIKECPVIINNAAVTVVRFGDKEIQLPSVGDGVKTVKVKFVKGKYTITNESESEKVDIEVEPKKVDPEVERTEEKKAIDEEESFMEIV